MKFLNHNFIVRANELSKYKLENVRLNGNRLEVIDKNKKGIITSPVIETREFTELVGSWSAITTAESTAELKIAVKSGGVWSRYFTYGEWGLGGENLYYNQKDEKVHMLIDEILLNDGNTGTAFCFEVVLKKEAKLSLVCITLQLPNYTYEVDAKDLPDYVCYDVPCLNQNMVPVIGGEMCSATTSAMLLKYKGFDFKDKDSEFEHRYIASLVADNGHHSPTYGNWVFNTAVISAFGVDSYVARHYSWEELKLHLATIGPVGASIRGDVGLYKTGGHLIVVRGYREVDGKTYVICNDPNINSRFGNDKDGKPLFVYYEFPLEVFESFHRGVLYVIE